MQWKPTVVEPSPEQSDKDGEPNEDEIELDEGGAVEQDEPAVSCAPYTELVEGQCVPVEDLDIVPEYEQDPIRRECINYRGTLLRKMEVELSSNHQSKERLSSRLWTTWRNPDGTAGGLVHNTARIDRSVYIAPGSVVAQLTRLKKKVVVESGVYIDRSADIEDNVRIKTGTVIGAYADVKKGATLGQGSTLKSYSEVKKNTNVCNSGCVGFGKWWGDRSISCPK